MANDDVIDVFSTTALVDVVSTTTVVEVVQGGPKGDKGDPGGLATTYVHDQGVASDIWIINHNLNRWPGVTVVASDNSVVEGDVEYVDANTIVATFASPFSGKAFLN